MIELSSRELSLKLDPAHGAEILELTDLRTGLQLLGRPLFEPSAPVSGDLDEASWTASYRGGWQLLAPNAGNACVVDGVTHGFHGRASVDPWSVVSCSGSRAELRWSGHGLELTRAIELNDDAVNVELSWTALSSPAPLIAVEHIVIGQAMLQSGCEIRADAAAHELSESSGPVQPPKRLPRWPTMLSQGGKLSDSGTVRRLDPERAGLAVLTGWAEGAATLASPGVGVQLELRWDPSKLGAAWLWEEIRESGGIWGGRTELLGFEVASVPHSLGLACATDAGQAWWARAGEHDGYEFALHVRPTETAGERMARPARGLADSMGRRETC